jgi:hypothetical protein
LIEIVDDVESIPRSFGYGQTVVKCEQARNGTNAYYETPHDIDSALALSIASCWSFDRLQGAAEGDDDNQGHHCGRELAESLHGKNGSNHSSSPSRIGEPWLVSGIVWVGCREGNRHTLML